MAIYPPWLQIRIDALIGEIITEGNKKLYFISVQKFCLWNYLKLQIGQWWNISTCYFQYKTDVMRKEKEKNFVQLFN